MSDDELYNRFLTGDVSSYDDLMIRYGDSMTVYLYGYLHNWHDAEDLMIEAFARILVKKPHIRSGNFKAYLFRTARNLATNFHAARKRADVFSLEELETELPGGSMPEEMLQEAETKRILQICMERIDPMIQEALWLVYRENLSYAETAAVMRISSKKVDNLLEKGKKVMREELKKEGISGAYE